jgi:DNA-binding beta-propeller fold protein YncE
MSFPRLTSRTLLGVVMLLILSPGLGCSKPKPPATNRSYAFWPPPPDEPRIQFLTSINSSKDISESRSSLQQTLYGKDTSTPLDVAKPYGIAMWNGRIYVTDIRGSGIIVLDLRNRQTRVMGTSGAGTVKKAVDIVVSDDGFKYVVDPTQSAILIFDPEERFVQMFPLKGARPVGAAIYKNLLYVADFKSQTVLVLDRRTGSQIRTIGEKGGEDGQFIQPIKVTADKDGNIYVSDVMKCRIQKFSPDGKLLQAFGQAGNQPGTFVRPKHLDIASDGILYVADAAFNNVQLFDEEGKVMMYFGSAGAHPGAMNLPAGLWITEQDMDLFARYVHPAFQAERIIIVSNQFGDAKISIYAMGQLKPGKTLMDITSRANVESGTVDPKATTQPSTAPARP